MTHTRKDISSLSDSISIFTKSATQAVCLSDSLTQLIIEFYPVWCVPEPSSQSHCTRRDRYTTSANSTRWSIKGIAGFNKWVATTQRSCSGAKSPGLCSWHYIEVIACTLVMFPMMKQSQCSDGQSTFFALLEIAHMVLLIQINHHIENYALLQRETNQWKDQAKNWQEHFLRVEQERCSLSSRVDELVSKRQVVCGIRRLVCSVNWLVNGRFHPYPRNLAHCWQHAPVHLNRRHITQLHLPPPPRTPISLEVLRDHRILVRLPSQSSGRYRTKVNYLRTLK